MSSLLIKNAKYLATMDGYDYNETGRELNNASIFCENGIIKSISSNKIFRPINCNFSYLINFFKF